MGSEQRVGTRRSLALQCRVDGKESSGNLPCELVTGDVSSGGLFLVSDDVSLLLIDQELDIALLRDNELLYRGPARVVRSQRLGEGSGPSGFGLELLTVDYGLANLIELSDQ